MQALKTETAKKNDGPLIVAVVGIANVRVLSLVMMAYSSDISHFIF